MERVAAEHNAGWHRGALDRVEHQRGVVVTKDGYELPYDMLVLALGARPDREWHADGVLTFRDGRDGPSYRLLLHQLREGRVNKLAFVKPTGPTWPMPLYDLALMTAADGAAHQRLEVELSLITPEEEPLGIFGASASAAVARLLDERGVSVHTSSIGVPGLPGWLEIRPGDRRLAVDRIVTVPRLAGPRLRGIPCGRDGFIHTDPHGRLAWAGRRVRGRRRDGLPDQAWRPGRPAGRRGRRGDRGLGRRRHRATAVPARPARGPADRRRAPRYLRADISGCAGDDSTISSQPLWWPPNKLSGRYLAPYLSRQIGEAADVMPQQEDGIPVAAEHPLERSAS